MTNSYTYSPLEKVYWDIRAEEALENEIKRLNLNSVFIVASSTLTNKTEEISKIKDNLGKKFTGLYDRCIEHSPLENVIDCVNEVEKVNPDIILTIGGGTPIDTVKVVQLCISLGIKTVKDLQKITGKHQNIKSSLRQTTVACAPWVRNSPPSISTKAGNP